MINQTISHYKILEEIGSGGMGVVYKAEDTKLDRLVALKFLPPHLMTSEEEKSRFVHEAKTAATLNHTNICTIHEIDEHDGQTFIAMEYIEGQSLKNKITERPLKLDEALEIAIQIAIGLHKAHDKQVVHRDIKPANILLSNDGVTKVVDFGLAKLSGQTKLTKDGSTLGTAAYMSPEQTRGEEVDSRTDIWSLGVVFYEMITGILPFKGDYEQAMQYSIVNEEPDSITGLRTGMPMELERIAGKALKKKTDERYQNIGDMLVDLKVLKKNLESDVKPHPSEVTEKIDRKNIFKRVSIIIGVALILILAFFMLKSFIVEEVLSSAPVPIAVLPFENLTGDSSYDILKRSIPNLLITKLEESKYLQVTTWERMRGLLKQIGEVDVEIADIDRDTGYELCDLDGVEAVVIGSLSKVGNMFATEVKVLDVETKAILKSASSQGEGEESIIRSQIDELSREISKGIGLSERKIEVTERPVAELTTSSMEAYHYFIRGKDEFWRWHYSEAVRFLAKATEIDSTFAMAYYWGISAYSNVSDYKSAQECREKAIRYAKYASEKDRLFIEMKFENDEEKRIRLLKQWVKKYPKEPEGHIMLAEYYTSIELPEKAIEEYNKALALDPMDKSTLFHISYFYLWWGKYEKALEVLEQYALAMPGDAQPIDTMGEAYLMMGNLDEAIAKYTKAFELESEFWGPRLHIGYMYGLKEDYAEAKKWIDQEISAMLPRNRRHGYFINGYLLYWLGNLDLALNQLDRVDELYREIESRNRNARTEWLRAWIAYEKGDLSLSRDYFDRCYDSYESKFFDTVDRRQLDYKHYLGIIDLKEGRIDSARYRLEEIKKIIPTLEEGRDYRLRERETFYADLLHGEILLAENSPDDAIAILEKKSPQDYRYYNIALLRLYIFRSKLPVMEDVLARAYYLNGQIDRAIEEYEMLTTFDPNRASRDLIHPKYHYRLAKLYEEKGENQKAIQRYQKFLTIWKNADDDLPEKIDAQKRLANLMNLNK